MIKAKHIDLCSLEAERLTLPLYIYIYLQYVSIIKRCIINMVNSLNIDRQSYEPAYAQLVRMLRQQIASGEFRKGSKLPSEADICKKFEVSPMTVRRAINVLADQGVITTVQGKGTFVKSLELGASSFDLEELQSMFKDKGRTKVQILESRIISAEGKAAINLAVEDGKRLIYVRRLMLRDQKPFLFHQEFLIYDPRRPIVEAQMDVTSLDGLFSGSGETDIKKGKLSITAVFLTEEETTLLKTHNSTPAFRLEHTFYDFEDQPVSYGWFTCPAENFHLTARVGLW
ncbi:MAG: GntR family transcriptional regulator [Deltaproteobacteria bacterium]|nr:GntR family transcriptional regulator [Deltaproteobacteria bacterium]